jgi:hypothetical protein
VEVVGGVTSPSVTETTTVLILGIIVSAFGIAFFCWLLFTLAVYALPFFVAMTAGFAALHSGAGFIGAIVVGIVVGIVTPAWPAFLRYCAIARHSCGDSAALRYAGSGSRLLRDAPLEPHRRAFPLVGRGLRVHGSRTCRRHDLGTHDALCGPARYQASFAIRFGSNCPRHWQQRTLTASSSRRETGFRNHSA